VYGVIEESGVLSDDYHVKIRALFNKYYPIEVDPSIPLTLKIPFMKSWWEESNRLLVAEKCNVSSFREMVKTANLEFRENVPKLLEELDKNDIPVLIFSAGIAELIEEIMKHFIGSTYSNVHVVSNHIKTDREGTIIGFMDPLIHTFNKNEMSIAHTKASTWFESLEHRNNVILVGDSLGDAGMATGVSNLDTIIKIGFLNHDVEKNLEHYKAVFDVLILNDGKFNFVLDLIREVLKLM